MYQGFFGAEQLYVVELKVQIDHVYSIVSIPPKLLLSNYVGMVKGKAAIRVLQHFQEFRNQLYWGITFGLKGTALTR